jgi:hypothetical protein
VAETASNSPGIAIGKTSAEFLNVCCRLVDLLRTPQDIPHLSGLIQRKIIYRILRGAEGASLRAIARLGDQSHRTAKAIAWIRAKYGKPLRVEHLAEIAGMGVSEFHHHFPVLTAVNPLQDQKQLRFDCRLRGAACFWMVWTRRVRALRSDTKAPANSSANTAVSSANHPCGIFGPFARRAVLRWSRSVLGKIRC